jgi:pimeloyl-ACP methyl ester carboxylesterase
MARFNSPAPDPKAGMEAYLAHARASSLVMGSPAYPVPESQFRAETIAAVERGWYPAGVQRQYAAVLASPDRRGKLAGVTAPTVVIHGEADALVPLAGGVDTAASIPGAVLKTFPGMGHDLPEALYDPVINAIAEVAARARVPA